MALAEAKCAGRGERLTPMRREVLAVLLADHQPLGAYEILDRLAPSHRRPVPYMVYRALEFLCGNGFVHRIESRNAYLACMCPHAAGDRIIFLICDRCGTVGEASSPEVTSGIESTASAADFDSSPKSTVIEVSGICTHCRRNQNGPQMS
jgi:Fur family zinc uptake transcriptional regulator